MIGRILLAASVLCATTCCIGAAAAVRATSPGTNPLARARLATDPESPAAGATRDALAAGDPALARIYRVIAREPQATWITGGQPPDVRRQVRSVVARAHGGRSIPVLVLYDITHRDCGGYSAGGASTATGYRQVVDAFAQGLGGGPAVVIVEPDALTLIATCGFNARRRADRLQLVRYAVSRIARHRDVATYLDAGPPGWTTGVHAVALLRAAGISDARGFATNVAAYATTKRALSWVRQLAHELPGTHAVIDTSRNGRGPAARHGLDVWCNPPGRALGHVPTTRTDDALVDAFLWIKHPGVSDGSCHPGDPPAGTWFPAQAITLVQDRSDP